MHTSDLKEHCVQQNLRSRLWICWVSLQIWACTWAWCCCKYQHSRTSRSYWIQPQGMCCPQFALRKKWVGRLISCHASLRLQVRGQGPSHWRGPGWQPSNFNWLKLMSAQHGIANISRLHQKMCTSFVRSHHFATSIGSKMPMMPASYEKNNKKIL